jgi:hypothetical protein
MIGHVGSRLAWLKQVSPGLGFRSYELPLGTVRPG